MPGRQVEGIDLDRVGTWLSSAVPELRLPLRGAPISGGRSNLTYLATDARGLHVVLRWPPAGPLQETAHDVEREAVILAALASSSVPVPAVLALSSEPDPLGAPLLAMEYAGGRTVANRDDAGRLGPSARQRLGRELVDVLANLHALDVDAAGLGSLRRPGGLVQRQLLRWRGQLDGYPALTTSLLEELHAELDRQMPEPQRTSLVHGDFKLANLRVDEAGNVVAVLDWELAAIGDPLIDLGWLVASWVDATDNRPWITKPPTAVGGFAAPQELIAWYASATGLDLRGLEYYVAFAYWRWSCINEGILDRIRSGAKRRQQIDPQVVRAQICWQAEEAANLLNGSKRVVDAEPAGHNGEVRWT